MWEGSVSFGNSTSAGGARGRRPCPPREKEHEDSSYDQHVADYSYDGLTRNGANDDHNDTDQKKNGYQTLDEWLVHCDIIIEVGV